MPFVDSESGKELDLEAARAYCKEKGYAQVLSQQAFDDIIGDRVKNKNKELDTLKEVKASLETELADAKKAAKSPPDKESYIPKAEHEALLKQRQDQLDKSAETIKTMQQGAMRSEIAKAAADSVAPDTVVSLLSGNIRVDEDGSMYPVDKDGNKIPNPDGKEGFFDVASYTKNFLGKQENSYLLKPSGNSGAESGTGSQGGAATGGTTIDKLADMPMDQFIAKGGLSSLGQ